MTGHRHRPRLRIPSLPPGASNKAHLIVDYRSERLGLLRPRPGRFAVIPNPAPDFFGGTGVRDLLFRFGL